MVTDRCRAALIAECSITTALPDPKPPAAPSLDGEHAVDAELVDRAVDALNRLCSAQGLERSLAIGTYVVTALFGGEPAHFRHRSERHLSFRALARREDLRVSYMQIWRAVSILEQVQDLPPGVADALSPTHHRLLLPTWRTRRTPPSP